MIIEFKQKEVLYVLTNETPSKLVQCCNCNLIASEEKFFKSDDPEDAEYCIDVCPSCKKEDTTEWFISEEETEVKQLLNIKDIELQSKLKQLSYRFKRGDKFHLIVK